MTATTAKKRSASAKKPTLWSARKGHSWKERRSRKSTQKSANDYLALPHLLLPAASLPLQPQTGTWETATPEILRVGVVLVAARTADLTPLDSHLPDLRTSPSNSLIPPTIRSQRHKVRDLLLPKKSNLSVHPEDPTAVAAEALDSLLEAAERVLEQPVPIFCRLLPPSSHR